jgi:hypothetical protein
LLRLAQLYVPVALESDITYVNMYQCPLHAHFCDSKASLGLDPTCSVSILHKTGADGVMFGCKKRMARQKNLYHIISGSQIDSAKLVGCQYSVLIPTFQIQYCISRLGSDLLPLMNNTANRFDVQYLTGTRHLASVLARFTFVVHNCTYSPSPLHVC